MTNPIQRLGQLGQSLWLDNITRSLLDTGGLARYRDEFGITGLTSNPTIFQKAIASSDAYLPAIRGARGAEPEALFFDLAIDDLRRAADLFAPVHARTSGVDGWVSLEVSPLLANDTPATIAQAQALHRRAARDNLFIKVPGTPAGVGAIEELIWRGVPINVTLLFSPAQYRASAEAYLRGLERRAEKGLALDIPSVASVFISRWDVKVAERIAPVRRNTLGLAVARACYADYCALLASPRMQHLQNLGARPQRLLWASTGTKDPAAPDILYVGHLAAALTINTLPEATLKAWADHGELPKPPLAADAAAAARELAALAETVGDIEALGGELQHEGAAAFDKSWHALLDTLAQRLKETA
ncbi:MAG: transaldolase [Nevskiaceae bacterium]|nr:MAG: transaldolase [Nevskiaceae bacterium]TBR72517.1 MAG: transaldolase [Nevskiaceae bacterium]